MKHTGKVVLGLTILLGVVTLAFGQTITSIYDVQYTTDSSGDSPLVGTEVTITGVVTAEFWGSYKNRQIFVQDSVGAWSGVMVYNYGGIDALATVAEGDSVVITGTVKEYYNKTEIDPATSIVSHGKAVNQITPITVTPADIKTGSATAESYEGVLVKVANVTVGDPDLGNGEWSVAAGTDSVRLDDLWDYYYWPTAGDSLTEVVGCIDYSYDDFKIQPRLARDVVETGTTRIQRIQQVLYSDLLLAGTDTESDTSYMYGDTVTIEGIVTMPTGLSYAGAGIKFIYEDEHGGPWSAILSYDPDSTAFPVLFEGDKVRATGYVYEYRTSPSNMTELFITQPIDILSVGGTIPEDVVTTGDLRWPTEAEQWGTVNVQVEGVTVKDNTLAYGEWSVDDGTGSVNIDDDSDSIVVWQTTFGRPPIGSLIDSIRGWVYHHYGSYGDSTAYKLEPLYATDIVFGAGPPSIREVARDPCVPGLTDEVTVTCEISDNSTVSAAEIMYSIAGAAYQSAAMTNTSGTTWSGVIPATDTEGAAVDYYVKATDDGVDQDAAESTTYPSDIAKLQLGYATRTGALNIGDIQFTEWPLADSRFDGCEVTVTGIITADTAQANSYYGSYALQSEDGGPWSGIIFDGWDGDPLIRGDEVTITGRVEEYDLANSFRYDNNTKIIEVSEATVLSSGNEVLSMLVQTADLAHEAEEVESYEGCLVTVKRPVISKVNQYDWSILDASGVTCLIDDDMANAEAVAFLKALEEGKRLNYVTGIFLFSYGTYKISIRDLDDLGAVSAVDDFEPLPFTFKLYPNFPNPFNPETRIRFEIPNREHVKMIVYDIRGYKVRTLANGTFDAGFHTLNWDGRNDQGTLVSSGVYVYRIKAGEHMDYKKMTLVR